MGAERWDEQVGSVADEAARLLESLRRAAADAPTGATGPTAPAAEPSTPAGDAAPPEGAGTGSPGCSDPFCQWCPLCRTSEVVRSLSPQTLSRLADLAGVAASVLADLASARTRDAGGGTGPAPAPEDGRGAGRTRPIPVRDADDPEEGPRG